MFSLFFSLSLSKKYKSGDAFKVYVARIGDPFDQSKSKDLNFYQFLCSSEKRQRKTSLAHAPLGTNPEFIDIKFNYESDSEETSPFCKETIKKKQVKKVEQAIENNLRYQFIIDSYPAWAPIGIKSNGSYHIYSHFCINISSDNGVIVNVGVFPSNPVQILSVTKISYTYSYVLSYPGDNPELPRFDHTEKNVQDINKRSHSTLSAFIESLVMLALFVFNCRNIFVSDPKTGQKTFSWKRLHGDVFRAPVLSDAFAVVCGMSMHIGCALLLTVLLDALFNFSESLSEISLFFTMLKLCSFIGGVCVSSLSNSFFTRNSTNLSIYYLLIEVFVYLFVRIPLGLFASAENSSFNWFHLWPCLRKIGTHLVVSIPLSHVGAMIANRFDILGTAPCETLPHPRINKSPSFILSTPVLSIALGFLIATSFSDQLLCLLTAFWHCSATDTRPLFANLLAICFISISFSLFATSARMENGSPHWQWNTVLSPLSTIVFLLVFTSHSIPVIVYDETSWSKALFYTYTLLISLLISLMSSAVSYLSSLLFMRRVFAK